MEKKCSIVGCNRPFRCKGFCGLHYSRVRDGSPDMDPNIILYKTRNQREKNGNWKGEFGSLHAGRVRAISWFSIDKCQFCGNKAIDRHHKDGNTLNNSPNNIQPLCRRCHMKLDGRIMDNLLVIAPLGRDALHQKWLKKNQKE